MLHLPPDRWLTFLAIACVGAGLLLLIPALRGRRPRSRTCPRCRYDLSGIAGLTCPECGRTARSERHLFRRRRSRLLLGETVVLLALPAIVAAIPRVQQRGWVGAVPTTALIALLPCLETPDWSTPVANTRSRRLLKELLHERTLWSWQRDALVNLCIRGTSARQPGAPDWWVTEGVLLSSTRERLSPRRLRILLDRAAPRLLRTRDTWPAGVPLRAQLAPGYEWLWSDRPRVLHVYVDDGSSPAASFAITNMPDASWGHQPTWCSWLDDRTLPLRAFAAHEPVRVRLELKEDNETVWRCATVLPVEIRGQITDLLTPTPGPPESDQPLIGHSRLAVRISSADATEIVIDVDADWFAAELQGATFAVVAEVLHEGRPVASGPVWFRDDGLGGGTPGRVFRASAPMDGDLRGFLDAAPDDPAWAIRLRPDPETALRDFGATRFWNRPILFTRGCVRTP